MIRFRLLPKRTDRALELCKKLTERNATALVEEIWTEIRKRHRRSLQLHSAMTFTQLFLSASIVVLNIYATRIGRYLTEDFVSIVIVMSAVTFLTSVALFLNIRARSRRNRLRYRRALAEVQLYRDFKDPYADPKTRDALIVQRLSEIRAAKVFDDMQEGVH